MVLYVDQTVSDVSLQLRIKSLALIHDVKQSNTQEVTCQDLPDLS